MERFKARLSACQGPPPGTAQSNEMHLLADPDASVDWQQGKALLVRLLDLESVVTDSVEASGLRMDKRLTFSVSHLAKNALDSLYSHVREMRAHSRTAASHCGS